MEDAILLRCERGTDPNRLMNLLENRRLESHGSDVATRTRALSEAKDLGTAREREATQGKVTVQGSQTQGCEIWSMVDHGRMMKIGDVNILLEIDRDEITAKTRYVFYFKLTVCC